MTDFSGLPRNHFPVAMMDAPWQFLARSDKGYGRSPDYDTMSLDWIKRLPVADVCTKDSVLLMWAVDPLFDVAFEVMAALGYKFKTIGYNWTKLVMDGTRPATGMGFWTRANPEICLLGTRGNPKRLDRGVPRLIETPADWPDDTRQIRSVRREHSRKPDEAYARTERLLAGPYLDLFSREDRPGWTGWGNEAGRFNKPRRFSSEISRLLDGPPPIERDPYLKGILRRVMD